MTSKLDFLFFPLEKDLVFRDLQNLNMGCCGVWELSMIQHLLSLLVGAVGLPTLNAYVFFPLHFMTDVQFYGALYAC